MPNAERDLNQAGSQAKKQSSSHGDLALMQSERPPSSETTGSASLDSEGSSSTGKRPGGTTVAETRGSALADDATLEQLLASLPYSLTRLVDVDSDGWTRPQSLTSAEIQSAKIRVGRAEALLKPADKALVRKWLEHLGVLCAGQMSATDAKMKIGAYVPLLDAPAAVLTKRTLQDAGRQFKWFPSFAELSEFLDGKTWVMRKLAARLKMLAETTPQLEHQPGSDWKNLTPEQQFEIDRKLAEAKRIIDGVTDQLRTPGGIANTPA